MDMNINDLKLFLKAENIHGNKYSINDIVNEYLLIKNRVDDEEEDGVFKIKIYQRHTHDSVINRIFLIDIMVLRTFQLNFNLWKPIKTFQTSFNSDTIITYTSSDLENLALKKNRINMIDKLI